MPTAAWAMRRDGTFVVELFTPLKHQNREVDHLVIAAPRYEHTIRWSRGEIPSGFALLAELSGLPERLLRQAVGPDIERITLALFTQAKFAQSDIFEGKIPLATPDELLPEQPSEERMVDQVDPRFPHFDGPIKRFPAPPVTQVPGTPPPTPPQANAPPSPPQQPGDLDLGLAAPEAMKAVS
jgi:hypothetical protein